jgi:hypothetical protein
MPLATPAPPLARPCPLPPERQFSVPDLRQLEIQRRVNPAPAPPQPSASASAPASGEPRRRWLREQLISVINDHTTVCPASSGAVAACMLELFERVTGELFSETPGALLTNWVRALAKVMGNLVREVAFDPPLLSGRQRDYVCWNRCPRERVDWQSWRRRTEAAEEYRAPVLRTRSVLASIDAGLASWIRQHRHLQPVDVTAGESGMALLLLWEVDHAQPFPTMGDATDRAAVLTGFTRRLQARIAADDELSQWLLCRDLQQPLAPGLADTHHRRWSVRICRPKAGEPQGWYDDFVSRWRSYLATQARPHVQPQAASASPDPSDTPSSSAMALPGATPAPKRRARQHKPPAVQHTPRAPAAEASAASGTPQPATQPRPARPGGATPPVSRQRDMRTWLLPRAPALHRGLTSRHRSQCHLHQTRSMDVLPQVPRPSEQSGALGNWTSTSRCSAL